jgi:uncharacterized membrane protein
MSTCWPLGSPSWWGRSSSSCGVCARIAPRSTCHCIDGWGVSTSPAAWLGLYLAFFSFGGFPARLGFAGLAILLIWTVVAAYIKIRQGDQVVHREWAIRSFALLFAAVTLRLLQVLYGAAGVESEAAYIAVAWSSWVPNLLVAELIVSALRRKSALRAEPAPA